MAAACIAAYPAIGMAADSTLVLVLGGEAYDGPPKFEVTFNGRPLGEGAVAAAIDTASVGRFADATDKTPYVQSFTFAIPNTLFDPEGAVGVTLINEAYGGDGSNRDRNLYLASVTINGRAVTASGLVTMSDAGVEPNAMLGEFLLLPDGNTHAISKAPDGGWPGPVGAIAEVREAATDPVVTASIAARLEPETAPSAASAESLEIASLDPDPEAGVSPVCDLDEHYNVIGFNENSNELTADITARLDQVIADIGARQCNVMVTGYSSKQGSYATNALFSVERAQNALRYLVEHGLRFVKANATGVGATDQFGPEFRENRRVVITVTP
jgi:outer membrane protein OmpA-like peptidoglycan-associated protein